MNDTSFERLNKVLETVTEALVDISNKRDEQTKSISDVSQRIELRTNSISERCNTLEKKIRKVENDNIENNNKTISLNKNIHSNFDRQIKNIEENIKQMEKALETLRLQYEENNRKLDELRPKVGKKRKWWQIGI
jgi:chromosome segregation ATPase